MKSYIVAYSYEAPFLESSGDHVRIRSIHDFLRNETDSTILCYCLGNKFSVRKLRGTTYVEQQKRLSGKLEKMLRYTRNEFLAENLTKLVQLFLDEPLSIVQTLKYANKANLVLVHGDMSTTPSTLRLLGFKGSILFDSLANYPQTLYMRLEKATAFRKAIEYMRLGIYLTNYRLQLHCSNKVLYPSSLDAGNAKRMYHLQDKIFVVPNIFTTAFKDSHELNTLRKKCRKDLHIDDDSIVLVFCAGQRSKANKDALNILINLDEKKLKLKNKLVLLVTGPWLDYREKSQLHSVFTGSVDRSELRGILAASDIGLAPIFEGSGTLLKVLEYISAGLPVVATPIALFGIPEDWLRESKIYVATDKSRFPSKVHEALTEASNHRITPSAELVREVYQSFSESLHKLGEELIQK